MILTELMALGWGPRPPFRPPVEVIMATRHGGHGTTEQDRLYTEDELEFLLAVEAWRKRHGRKFPANTDLLAIAVSLGYRKVEPPGPLPRPRSITN